MVCASANWTTSTSSVAPTATDVNFIDDLHTKTPPVEGKIARGEALGKLLKPGCDARNHFTKGLVAPSLSKSAVNAINEIARIQPPNRCARTGAQIKWTVTVIHHIDAGRGAVHPITVIRLT